MCSLTRTPGPPSSFWSMKSTSASSSVLRRPASVRRWGDLACLSKSMSVLSEISEAHASVCRVQPIRARAALHCSGEIDMNPARRHVVISINYSELNNICVIRMGHKGRSQRGPDDEPTRTISPRIRRRRHQSYCGRRLCRWCSNRES